MPMTTGRVQMRFPMLLLDTHVRDWWRPGFHLIRFEWISSLVHVSSSNLIVSTPQIAYTSQFVSTPQFVSMPQIASRPHFTSMLRAASTLREQGTTDRVSSLPAINPARHDWVRSHHQHSWVWPPRWAISNKASERESSLIQKVQEKLKRVQRQGACLRCRIHGETACQSYLSCCWNLIISSVWRKYAVRAVPCCQLISEDFQAALLPRLFG